jgi:CheY-like chemotaxis protein
MMLRRELEIEEKSCPCSFGRLGYQLVLMDCNMPILDGFEATKRIKQMVNEGHIKEAPCIIALTAYATDSFKKKCLASGMEDVVTKPISAKQIGKLLEEKGIILSK